MVIEDLLISNSGGLTSAFMTHFLLNYPKYSGYKKHVVFANTGKENEETLEFINKCDKELGFNTVWVEAVISQEKGKGVSFKIVNFETASRNGEPFNAYLKKFGLPSMSVQGCTRDLKQRTIRKYIRSKTNRYVKALGIRADEHVDFGKTRGGGRTTEDGMPIIYPLSHDIKATSSAITDWWSNQSFTLELEEHEGNCDLCWKKSLRKKVTLIREGKIDWKWWAEWEKKTGQIWHRDGKTSVLDMVELSKDDSFISWHPDNSGQTSLFDISLDSEFSCLCK